MSLTGDPRTDRMVPTAVRMVGAVREWDLDEVTAALDEAGDDLPVLVLVLAAMVPYDRTPGELLRWVGRRDEFKRLVEYGIDPSTAATIVHNLRKGDGTAV
jgi:hypothetical protein